MTQAGAGVGGGTAAQAQSPGTLLWDGEGWGTRGPALWEVLPADSAP